MTEVRAYDMSRFQRIIGVDGQRVSGNFQVLATDNRTERWVTTLDVTVWDEGHHSGRILHSGDLTCAVVDGQADLRERAIAVNKLADVQDAWDEMKAAIVAASEAFGAVAVDGTGTETGDE